MEKQINLSEINKKIDEIPGICTDGKKGVKALMSELLTQLGAELKKEESSVGSVFKTSGEDTYVILSNNGYNHIFISNGEYVKMEGGLSHEYFIKNWISCGHYKEFINLKCSVFSQLIIKQVEKDAEETSGGIK